MSGDTVDQLTQFGTPLDGPVTADAVEAALAASWRQIRSAQSTTQPVARASVLSLIVCVVDPTATSRILEAIGNLSQQHPSRTIILLPNHRSTDTDLQVWHATGCTTGGDDERVVYGEQIVIAARGQAINFLPSLTDQLMLTDLPAFLWWVGDLPPARDLLFDRLTGLADRLVADSSDFSGLGSSMDQLSRLARRRHQPCAPSDLNWARLTPWRELVAQFFDSSALRPLLHRIDDVAVDYNPVGGAGVAQAWLLVGWLARQLGWQLDEGVSAQGIGPSQGRLRRGDGGVVRLAVRPVDGGGVDGLRRVSLGAARVASFLVARENDSAHALTEADVPGAPVLRRIARCETAELSSLLADEITLFRRDYVYEAVLRLAVDLSDGIQSRRR